MDYKHNSRKRKANPISRAFKRSYTGRAAKPYHSYGGRKIPSTRVTTGTMGYPRRRTALRILRPRPPLSGRSKSGFNTNSGGGGIKRKRRFKSVRKQKISYGTKIDCGLLGNGRQLGNAGAWLPICDNSTGWEASGVVTPSLFLPTSLLEKIRQSLPVQLGATAFNEGVTPGPTAYNNPIKFRILSAKMVTNFQNVGNFGLHYEAYYCKPRQDIGVYYNNIDEIIAAAVAEEGALWNLASQAPTLFNFHKFTQLFKIYKVKKGFIPAGGGEEFVIERNKPININAQDYCDTSSNLGDATVAMMKRALKKCTKFIVYRYKGLVGNDVTTKAQTTVTTGQATVDWTTQHRILAQTIIATLPRNVQLSSTSLSSSAAVFTVPAVGFSFIADDLDAAATYAAS